MIGALGDLLLRLYDLAYIERWNDHPKPFHITELDKQAHKAVIAYVIAKVEGGEVDWEYLIEGLIFEALQRSVLTDIKPPIFHRLLKEAGERIHSFVLKKVGDSLRSFDEDMYEGWRATSGNRRRVLKKGSYGLPTSSQPTGSFR